MEGVQQVHFEVRGQPFPGVGFDLQVAGEAPVPEEGQDRAGVVAGGGQVPVLFHIQGHVVVDAVAGAGIADQMGQRRGQVGKAQVAAAAGLPDDLVEIGGVGKGLQLPGQDLAPGRLPGEFEI